MVEDGEEVEGSIDRQPATCEAIPSEMCFVQEFFD